MDPLFHPQMSLGQIVLHALSRTPNLVAQICHEDGHEMLNHEIVLNSIRVSLNLRELGLKEGEVLGFAAGNSRYVSSVVFAAMLNGNPVGTLDPSFAHGDVSHIFGITQPKLVLCDKSNYAEVKRALNDLQNPSPIYVFDAEEPEEGDTEWISIKELLRPHPEEKIYV